MKNIYKLRPLILYALAILIIILPSNAALAQDQEISVVIERIITTNFPEVEAFISIYDQNTLQISGIAPSDIILLEDDISIPAEEFSFFREINRDTPLAIALLIDTTGSMFEGDPAPIENTVAAAKTFVESLLSHDEVGLISFSDAIRVEQTLTTEKSLVLEALNRLEGQGDTPLYNALYQGMEMLRESEKRKVIIVITDGYDSASREYILEEALSLANEYRVTVYPIGFGPVLISESGAIALSSNLDEIAASTGGFEQYLQDSAQLPEAFNEINQFLRRIYRVAYTSSLPAEDSEHELEVQITLAGETYSDSAMFVPNPVKLQVLNPQPGSMLSITTPITIEASAPSKINRVEIWIDGEVWQSFSAPTQDETIYQIDWELAEVVPGEHNIMVRAFDIIGNRKELDMFVSVREPIIIDIINPTDGAVLVTRPIIEVSVDSVAEIDSVALLLNEKTLATFTEEYFTYEWPPEAIDHGLYKIRVEAVDTLGHSSTKEINVRIGASPIQETLRDGASPSGNLIFILFGGGIAVALLLVLLPLILKKNKPKPQSSAKGPQRFKQQSPQSPQFANYPNAPQASSVYQHTPSADTTLVLKEETGLRPGTVWPLEKGEVKLGRSKSDNDIQLQGSTTSRRMAIIRKTGNGYVLHPLHPENPVYINQQPISNQVLLKAGDQIRLGDSSFWVVAYPAVD